MSRTQTIEQETPTRRVRLHLHEQSLRELSQRTGLHESLLSRLLNRRRQPTLPVLVRIAQTCGLTLDEAYRQLN